MWRADGPLLAELAALGARHDVTRGIATLRIYPGVFPVDSRHEAKIERELERLRPKEVAMDRIVEIDADAVLKLIEFNDTDVLFTTPGKKQTEDYITGRFG